MRPTRLNSLVSNALFLALLAGASTAHASASGGLDSLRVLVDTGELARAETVARSLLRMEESASRPDSLTIALILDELAVVLRRTGRERSAEAEEVCERALVLKRATVGAEDTAYAASLHGLGALYYARMEYARSKPILTQAYEIRRKQLGEEHPDVAWSLMTLGALESETGSDSVAVGLIERCVEIQRKRPDTKEIDRVLGLNALATIRNRMGDYVGAVALYEEALALLRRGGDRNEAQVGTVSHNLGVLQLDMNDLTSARTSLERALKLRRKNLGKDHPMVAFTLMALGGVHEEEGDLARAWANCADALLLFRSAYGLDNSEVGWAKGKLGQIALLQGRRSEAATLFRESLSIQERAIGIDHPTLGPALLGLAEATAASGGSAAAESLFLRSESILEGAYGPLHPDLGDALARHARFLAARGDSSHALDRALRAARIAREHVRLATRGFGERQVLAYARRSTFALDLALSIVSSRPVHGDGLTRTWDELIRSRALVFDEMARRNRYAQSEALRPEWERLRRGRQALASLLVRGPGKGERERYRMETTAARAAVERAERDLARASASFGAALELDHAGYEQIVNSLPNGDALVAYTLLGEGPSRSYLVFVLGPSGVPTAITLGPATDVERQIRRWRAEVTRMPRTSLAEENSRTAGRELRARIWDRIEPHVRGARTVFLVPDGDLHGVSFAALPREIGGYLVESAYMLHFLSTERDLAAAPARIAGRGLLAVGGIDFDRGLEAGSSRTMPAAVSGGAYRGAEPDCDQLSSIHFPPLPESAAEAEAVVRLWKPADEIVLLVGTEATERAVTRRSAGKRVLHLATHGFVLRDPCDAVASRPGTRGIGGTVSSRRERGASQEAANPLRLSGLVLAGANRRRTVPHGGEEDGILTSEEIASLDLSGVEWAVLSACETGGGDFVAREGVLGLSRAFRVAQVGTLIVSLWPVEDPFARAWMAHLYEGRFRKGLATAEAVREATLAVLRDRRARGRSTHPFHWSAFIATGARD